MRTRVVPGGDYVRITYVLTFSRDGRDWVAHMSGPDLPPEGVTARSRRLAGIDVPELYPTDPEPDAPSEFYGGGGIQTIIEYDIGAAWRLVVWLRGLVGVPYYVLIMHLPRWVLDMPDQWHLRRMRRRAGGG